VGGEGEGYAVVEGLEALPEGRAYQLWSLRGGESTSLGLLGDGTTDALAVAPAAPGPDVRLAISEEPAGGVPAPTGRIVATGSFA
jgi:anti-sigma-K factor RskA